VHHGEQLIGGREKPEWLYVAAIPPLADEHIDFEVELDAGPDVMRYLGAPGRAARWGKRTGDGSPPHTRCRDLGSGPASPREASSAGGSCNRRTDQTRFGSPGRQTSATGCCAGTGGTDTPARVPVSSSAMALRIWGSTAHEPGSALGCSRTSGYSWTPLTMRSTRAAMNGPSIGAPLRSSR
jgi:hypothetical protein